MLFGTSRWSNTYGIPFDMAGIEAVSFLRGVAKSRVTGLWAVNAVNGISAVPSAMLEHRHSGNLITALTHGKRA